MDLLLKSRTCAPYRGKHLTQKRPLEKILVPNTFEVDSLQIASRSGLHLRRALRFSFGSEDVLDDGGVQTVAHLLCASLQNVEFGAR